MWAAGPTYRIPRHHVHPKMKSWAVALNVSILGRKRKEARGAPWAKQSKPFLFYTMDASDWVVATLIFTVNDSQKEMLFRSRMAFRLGLKLVVTLHNVGFSNMMLHEYPQFQSTDITVDVLYTWLCVGPCALKITRARFLFSQTLQSTGKPNTNGQWLICEC